MLPLIRKYGAAVVAISNDDTGISEDPDVRFEVARRIVERAADHGIPREDVIVDPLVMPIGAMATAGQQVFRLVRRLREELGVNTTCGASNVSFGMPDRERINAAFLPMAIASGLTSAITNPLAAEVKAAIMAADVLMGNDQDAGRWIRAHREAAHAPPRRARAPRRARRAAVAPRGCRAGVAERHRGRLGRSAGRPGTGRGSIAGPSPPRPRCATPPAGAADRGPDREPIRWRAPVSDDGPGHLHAIRSARPVRARDDRPRCGAIARRRPRLGVRRAGPVRPLPGRAGRGQLPEARHRIERRPPLAARRGRGRVRPAARARGGPPARVSRARRRRRPRRRAAREPGPSPGRAQGRAGSRLRHRSGRDAARGRGRAAGSREARRRPRAAACRARSRSGGSTGLEADLEVDPRAPAGARGGRLQGHRRGPRPTGDHRCLAGAPRPGARRRAGHRLDDDRRAPREPRRRRGPRLGRRDEPADPVRRGPHEPRLLRDAPRGRRRAR